MRLNLVNSWDESECRENFNENRFIDYRSENDGILVEPTGVDNRIKISINDFTLK